MKAIRGKVVSNCENVSISKAKFVLEATASRNEALTLVETPIATVLNRNYNMQIYLIYV